jgi:hypothetical protein
MTTQSIEYIEQDMLRVSNHLAVIGNYQTESLYVQEKHLIQSRLVAGTNTTMPRVKFHSCFSCPLTTEQNN